MPVTTDRYQPDRHHRLARSRAGGANARRASPSSTSSGSSASASRLIPALLRLSPSVGGSNVRPGWLAHRSPHPRRRGQPHLAVHRRDQDQRPGVGRHAAVRAAQCRPRFAHRGRARPAIGALGLRSDRRRDRRQWGRDASGYSAIAEGGSFGFARASASGALTSDPQSRWRHRLAARQRDRQLQRPRRQGRLPQSLGPAARNLEAARRGRTRRMRRSL